MKEVFSREKEGILERKRGHLGEKNGASSRKMVHLEGKALLQSCNGCTW
jgi:hypothetical protein